MFVHSEVAGMSEVCVYLSSPNLIESLIRSATQNGKQMDVAVGEENTVCIRLCSYGNSQKIAEVRYVQSLLYTQVQTGAGYSSQTGKYLCSQNTCVTLTVNRVVVPTPRQLFVVMLF